MKLPVGSDVDLPRRHHTMDDVFSLLFEYRLLVGKEQVGVPLEDAERTRLIAAVRLLSGEVPRRDRRAMPRVHSPVRAQFTLPGGFGDGEVLNVSGGGMAIATRHLVDVGTRCIVRVAREASEYVFPCRVVWSATDPTAGMGVAFDGLPSRTMLRPSGVWQLSLRFGPRDKEPIAA